MSDNANQTADQAWQELLRQLREQPTAPPRPFFYTRLQARLAGNTTASRLTEYWPAWLSRPAYAMVMALLTFALHADSVGSRPHAGLSGGATSGRAPAAVPAGR